MLSLVVPETPSLPVLPRAPHRCPFNIPTCSGCPASEVSHWKTDQILADQDDLSKDSILSHYFSGGQAEPVDTWSPAIFRSQLKEEFRNVFFSPSFQADGDFMYCQFLGGECLQPKGAAMTAAVDALCLLLMGARRKDKALLREASKRYDDTMANLKMDLRRRDAVHDDGMLAAIWILHFCDCFTPTSGTAVSTRIHKQAVERILKARGPVTDYSPLGQALVYNARVSAISFGMVTRTPVILAERSWAKRASSVGTLESEFTEVMLQVPGMLYRFDRLISQGGAFQRKTLFSLLKEFTHIEQELISWLTRWIQTLPGEVFHTVPASAFPHFEALTPDVSGTFPSAIEYPSFAVASLQMTYWTGLMQVKQSIVDLIDKLQDPGLIRIRRVALLEDLNECADLLCRSAAFTTQPMYGFCGIFRCLGPVYFAAKRYHRTEQWTKLHWAHVLTKAVKVVHDFASPYDLPPDPC